MWDDVMTVSHTHNVYTHTHTHHVHNTPRTKNTGAGQRCLSGPERAWMRTGKEGLTGWRKGERWWCHRVR